MFDQYSLIMHKELNVVIMVPNQWPARAEPILMTLVEKIMERFNELSPIVRVNNMPTRLVRRDLPAGIFYVFDQVTEREIPGAYIYDVIVPDNKEAIRLEFTTGTTLSDDLWSPTPERFLSHVEKIYRYLSIINLRRKVVSAVNGKKRISNRRCWWPKRVHRREQKRDSYHRMKYQRKTG